MPGDPDHPRRTAIKLSARDGALVVSEPRQPCFKFDAAMGFAQASSLMTQSGYCGAYLAVLHPGTLQAGDEIELIPGPRQVNLRELFMARQRRRR